MSDLSRKIREARKRQGLNQVEFARAIGVTQSTISKWESGAQRPDVDAAIKLSIWANEPAGSFMFEGDEHPFVISDLDTFVDVIGCAEGDKWLEKIEWDENDHFKVQLPTPKTMDFSDLRGWLVKDEGISKLYPRDSVVFCRPESNPDLIGNFDRVLVVRENDNGLFEITIREIAKYKDIVINLRSHARDPDQIRSFDLKPLRLGPGIKSMRIVGVVVASFALEPYRDPAPSPGWE